MTDVLQLKRPARSPRDVVNAEQLARGNAFPYYSGRASLRHVHAPVGRAAAASPRNLEVGVGVSLATRRVFH